MAGAVLTGVTQAEDRFALVIGNSNYGARKLRNPGNDADLLADSLAALNFTVLKHKDLNGEGMGRALVDFRRKLTEKSVAVFFFAGHGIQVSGENYLIPIGVDPQEEYEVKHRCMPVGQVLDALDESDSSLNVVILDCCRDNPFERSWTRSSSAKGLAAVSNVPEGTVIAFSTATGKVAQDGNGRNSPYSKHLCQVLNSRPATGLVLRDVFFEASRAVRKETQQRPWLNLDASLDEYYLWRGTDMATDSAAAMTGSSQPSIRPSTPAPQPTIPAPARSITNSLGMQLNLIPAGEFQMGSPEDEKDRDDDEGPQHRVRITTPFYLGMHEVTQGQYDAVMGDRPWEGKSYVKEGSDFAASYVTWNDAVDFCERLSQREGRTYRLPTEAEWEYACRGGTRTAYHFGDDASQLGQYAWYDDNAWDIGEQYAHEVGQKQPNAFGLYDMHGNVWEWCADRYNEDYYANSPVDDPTGPHRGSHRVSRGGSWISYLRRCRSAIRVRNTPAYRDNLLGFRVALVPAD